MAGTLLVYANQGLSSIANLAISFFLVRHLGVSEFGVYATYFAIAFGISAILNALIASPLVSLSSQKSPAVAAGMIVSAGIAVAAAGLGLLVLAAGLDVVATLALGWSHECLIAAAFGISMAGAEFCRRIFFLNRRIGLAWSFDLIRLGALLAGSLAMASLADGLAATDVVLVFSAANAGAVVLFVAPAVLGQPVRPRRRRLSSHAGYFLGNGKWLAISSMLQLASDQALLVLTAAIAGPFAAGAIKTCQTIVGIVNPVLMALEHTLPRRLGEDLRRFGPARAHRTYLGACLLTLAAMAAALLPVAIFSPEILYWVSRGELAGHENLLRLFCALWMLYPVTQMVSFVYRAQARASLVMASQVLAAVLAVGAGLPLIAAHGAYGAALGTIIAQVTAIGFLALLMRRILAPRPGAPAA